ncbi:DUF1648 domain-containing protein [uncultured Enorma sp.]|uniref:DUF1648 domain-containing protein n=1 Tax=uncultured Enorma sp. TaxID=1714346 RepID=UPI00265EC706|nr:DUF1648 domain-containing protein [uncultured Enorma sp.]
MFQYGRVNGYLTIALIVVGVLPLAITFFVVPLLPDSVAMAFNSAGEATRFGSRYELFWVPVVSMLLAIATLINARRSANANRDSRVAEELVYRRGVRNGVVIGVLLTACTIYLLYSAYTGTGISFGF